MSHENSIQIDQRELASEYGRYVESKSNKGFMNFLIKALLIPLFALMVIATGAAFIVANYSPDTYTQAKEIIFSQVDFEGLTGQSNAMSEQTLDSWLILNSDEQQGVAITPENQSLGEMVVEEQPKTEPGVK